MSPNIWATFVKTLSPKPLKIAKSGRTTGLLDTEENCCSWNKA